MSVWAARRSDIERMIEEGKGLREMAEYFGTSMSAVRSAMQRMRLYMKPEDIARRQAERILATHTNPEIRARRIAAVARANKSTSRRENTRARMKELWKDPEYQQFIKEKVREAYEDPEYRAKVREGGFKGGAATKRKLQYDKWFKSLSKFEQQLELVRTGRANIVTNWNRRRV